MPLLPRVLVLAVAGLACLGASRTAAAWVETSVSSDAITVDVDKGGRAIVSHDLWMKIRGGPFKGTRLDGIDSDAEPLPDAAVTKIAGSGRAEQTKALLVSRGDDDSLYIEVDDSVGLRSGTYAFRFKYRTDLRQKSRISLRGSWAELGWVGPRYAAGLDVAKVTFRLPYASLAPRLPEIDPGAAELAQGELLSAAMLSTLRRGSDADELELVRPHVAKGEPVLWRIWTAPGTFSWLSEPKLREPAVVQNSVRTPRSPLGKGIPLVLAAAVSVLIAVLAMLKDNAVGRMAARHGCTPRPLVAVGAHIRAAAAGLLVSFSVLLAVRFDAPSAGAFALLLGLACMTYRAPVRPRLLRGPGRWLPLRIADAMKSDRLLLDGAFLDTTTSLGKCALGAWTMATVGVALWQFSKQPYLSVLAFVATVIPWPLFLTGRISELPASLRKRAWDELGQIHRELSEDDRLRVHAVGRFNDGDAIADEIRLRVVAKPIPEGLICIEVAAGSSAMPRSPCLLIRVRDNSDALRRYGRSFTFTRGRSAEERVAVYAPSIAPRARILRQVTHLLLCDPPTWANYGTESSDSSSNAERSSGKGSKTSKPSKPPAPAQATRAA